MKHRIKLTFIALLYFMTNHIIANIPFWWIRKYWFTKILRMQIGNSTYIGMNVRIGGYSRTPLIILGDNCVVNRKCFLDGRGGIQIGNNVNLSFGCSLLTLSHDVNSPSFSTFAKRIQIEKNSWIGADAFLLPGVYVAEGTVIGAKSVLTKNTSEYEIWAGNPANKIGIRSRELQYVTTFHPLFDTDISII